MDIEIGSLSKAFSVMGGFIAAKQPLVDAYLMSARQRLFSIALTIPVRAAQSLPGPACPTYEHAGGGVSAAAAGPRPRDAGRCAASLRRH